MPDNNFNPVKRQSSVHYTKYEKVNKTISIVLLIYCIIQLIIAFSDKEMPKLLDIVVNFIAVALSFIGFGITWYAIHQSHSVGVQT
jgi:hypothetical protein